MAISSYTLIFLIFIISFVYNKGLANSKPSAFDFLKNIQGCRKGQKVKGIQELKQYLENFGYLNQQNISLDIVDDFDDQLEMAIKTYQRNFHLKATGILDSDTVSKMMLPRCGVADIINGKTRMESGKNSHRHNSASKFHIVSHYAFFPEKPKWPEFKYNLTYGFEPETLPAAVEPVKRAFRTWQASTQFIFEITEYYYDADLIINFCRGDHGDGAPFDGPGGTLAHARPPIDGSLHFDADEKWVVGKVDDGFDIESTALHEIGHLLGLDHSSVKDAIMFPHTSPGAITRTLHDDDIQGIKALYNV